MGSNEDLWRFLSAENNHTGVALAKTRDVCFGSEGQGKGRRSLEPEERLSQETKGATKD